jgi:hypothetical protein
MTPTKAELGPNQVAWCRKHIEGFKELEAMMQRIREEQERNRKEMAGAQH